MAAPPASAGILADLRRAPTVGVEDMVMLQNLNDKTIVQNLKERHAKDMIYTSIGNVLISVNPFKRLPIYGADQIHFYKTQGKSTNIPHIFGLAERMYRQMVMEEENQCVIISGESGAGKTEAAKKILELISAISGDSADMQHVKMIILESNPLLEAFGNAKTVRNDNSSRFGKFFEIYFDRFGGPIGGKMSNFLLEKSRVVRQQRGERNFHVFYQLCVGADAALKQKLRLRDPSEFHFLNQGGTTERAGVDDGKEWQETVTAMEKIGFKPEHREGLIKLLAAILHIGELQFRPIEAGKDECKISNPEQADFVAELLQVDKAALQRCLTWKVLEVGANEKLDVPLDHQQCINAREALAKTIYDKIFNFVVEEVNRAFGKKPYALMLGVLDIYGFEIFDKNGFEQFCINYVNEKLQQIFIELTLKAEQEEYVREKIKWDEIKYFNNKVVCDLIEGRQPAGLFAILDDVCATMSKEKESVADVKLLDKLDGVHCGHAHFRRIQDKGFLIKHYAGDVEYSTQGFVNRNKDLLSADIMSCIATTQNAMLQKLIEDIEVDGRGGGSGPGGMQQAKKKATTAGFKIVQQAAQLVTTLMKCQPHYVRTIKSNDDKAPNYIDDARVQHQIKYLGLLENIRVRRAGFAYRQYFDKFLKRFKYTCPSTYPRPFKGPDKKACEEILRSNGAVVHADHWQLGETKVFLRHPQTLYAMEELREKTFDGLVAKIQRCYLRYHNRREYIVLKKRMDILYQKANKARRSDSVFRPFQGTYIDFRRDLVDFHPLVEYDPVGDAWRDEFAPDAKRYYFNTVTGRSQWEKPKEMDKQRIIYSDKVERVVDHPRGAKREEYFILSDRNLFLMEQRLETITPPQIKPTKQNPKPVQPQPYQVMKTYLHKKLDLRFLSGISTSKQADSVVVLHFYPAPVPYRPVEMFTGKEYTHCMLSGAKFGAKDKKANCPGCGLLCLPQWLTGQRPVPMLSGHGKPIAMCQQCADKPEAWEPVEDVVIMSIQKTEIIAILRRVYKHLLGIKIPVNINDQISYQLAFEKTPRVINFQLNAAAPDTQLFVGGPTQLVIHAPLGIDQAKIQEIGAQREARAKANQERMRNERAEEAKKEEQKEKEREEAHKRMIEQRKQERLQAAEREEQEKEEKLRKAREAQEQSRARVAAKTTK